MLKHRLSLADLRCKDYLAEASVTDVQNEGWKRFIGEESFMDFTSSAFSCEFKSFFRDAFPIVSTWIQISRKLEVCAELQISSVRVGVSRYSDFKRYVGLKGVSYTRPLYATFRMILKERSVGGEDVSIREIREEEMHILDLPFMSPEGTFVINGIERVVLMQLVRAPGLYFSSMQDRTDKKVLSCRINPLRGTRIEVSFYADGEPRLHFDNSKLSLLMSAVVKIMHYAESTPESPMDLGVLHEKADYSSEVVKRLLSIFNPVKYQLGNIGRNSLNNRLDLTLDASRPTSIDLLAIQKLVLSADSYGAIGNSKDDIDHIGNKRIRCVGEQLLDVILYPSAIRLVSEAKTKLSFPDYLVSATALPHDVLQFDQIQNALNSFFSSNTASVATSQYMDQTNALSMSTQKRRVTVLGHGGIVKSNAGFEIRDVHYSYYGRLCPVETPEGGNIGLISSLASLAKVDSDGRLLAPYYRVENGKVHALDVVWLDAFEEEDGYIASYGEPLDEDCCLKNSSIFCRHTGDYVVVERTEITHIDCSSQQMLSYSAGLVPFVEHDDANRALMGANMQRQAVPLEQAEAPIVGTGIEKVLCDSQNRARVSAGTVVFSDPKTVAVKNAEGVVSEYAFKHLETTNQGMGLRRRPLVSPGDKITDLSQLSETNLFSNDELSLGKNVLVAFMPFDGWNYEDAVVVSERLIRDRTFNSINIEEFRVDIRATKFGSEETTTDIPNIPEADLCRLDYRGIIKVGSTVNGGDILVGKITPKGMWSETSIDDNLEDKLVRAIFGSKADPYTDSSLRMPFGFCGTVIGCQIIEGKKSVKREPEQGVGIEKKQLENEKDELERKRKSLLETPSLLANLIAREIRRWLPHDNVQAIEVCKHLKNANQYQDIVDALNFLKECCRVSEDEQAGFDDFLTLHNELLVKIEPTIFKANLVLFENRVSALSEQIQDLNREVADVASVQKDRSQEDPRIVEEQNSFSAAVKRIIGESRQPISRLDTGELIYTPGDEATEEVVEYISSSILMGVLPVEKEVGEQLKNAWTTHRNRLAEISEMYYWEEKNETDGDPLPQGVLKTVVVQVASIRPLSVGDKVAGRHGNKGVVSRVLPIEDMPYMEDGTSVDIVLNPLGVPSRMNVGQLLETVVGWAASELGVHVSIPSFSKLSEEVISDFITKARQKKEAVNRPDFDYHALSQEELHRHINHSGQVWLYDGFTGKRFDSPVTVGIMYMMKLNHMIEDKMHARSTGPYSAVTQQPLQGKANHGGQRVGEMEVWALEAYGAAYTLKELLTVKSDDVVGRYKMYNRLINGRSALETGIPEGLIVLQKELQGLGLNFDLVTAID